MKLAARAVVLIILAALAALAAITAMSHAPQVAGSSIIVGEAKPFEYFGQFTMQVRGYTVTAVNDSYVSSIISMLRASCNLTNYSIVRIAQDYVDLKLSFPPPYKWGSRGLICNMTPLSAILAKPIEVAVSSTPTLLVLSNASGFVHSSRLTIRVTVGVNPLYTALIYAMELIPGPAFICATDLASRRLKGTARLYRFMLLNMSLPYLIVTALMLVSMMLDCIDPLGMAIAGLVHGPVIIVVVAAIVLDVVAAVLPPAILQWWFRRRLLREFRPYLERVVDMKAANRLLPVLIIPTIAALAIDAYISTILFFTLHRMPLVFVPVNMAIWIATFIVIVPAASSRISLWAMGRWANMEFNPALTRIVEDIWARVSAHSPAPRVYLVDSVLGSIYNAAATSGNRILVSRRLMGLVDDEELRSVLIHEVGHLRHSHIRLVNTIYGLLLAVFATAAPLLTYLPSQLFTIGLAAMVLTPMAIMIPLILWIVRRAERGADEEILRLGFNPRAYISALGKLARVTEFPEELGRVERAFMTHPTPLTRVLALARRYGIPRDEAVEIFMGLRSYRQQSR